MVVGEKGGGGECYGMSLSVSSRHYRKAVNA